MKEVNIFISGCVFLLMNSCVSTASIYSLCEKDEQGNYIVKWEISPDPQKGEVEIYSSSNDNFSKNKTPPLLVTNVEDRVAMFNSPFEGVREFFLLKTNNAYSGIITNRNISFERIQNFRDLGGYFNVDSKQLRWGKLFRCGNLFKITHNDIGKLKQLGVKTIIDLRSEQESHLYPDAFLGFSHFQIPIDTLSGLDLQKRITNKTFLRGDAIIYMQDGYRSILENNTKEIKDVFNILLNEKNYPILVHDNLGKDRTGIISYLILRALDITGDDAMSDYMLSNEYINLDEYMKYMDDMPEPMQEAMTVAVRANEDYIEYAFNSIIKKYGSIDLYFEKALGLSLSKRQKLKDIMLY
jgi:protein-tyrosine phosphatase